MKVVGFMAGLLALAILVFAVSAWFELRSAATSELVPSADTMPLTRLVYPELFDTANSGSKPAELARSAFNRIYLIGSGSIVLLVVGILILAKSRRTRTGQRN